jgi:UDP-glucose 4-epimerase
MGCILNILITGGTGFIGSHIAALLLQHQYKVVLYDNLSNSSLDVLKILSTISKEQPIFVKGEMSELPLLVATIHQYEIDVVIHLAALKSVEESNQKPLDYYDKNLLGSINLIKALQISGIKKIIYASSCSVYGNLLKSPIQEQEIGSPESPYAYSKWLVEQILQDVFNADPTWNMIVFRYFNVAGADKILGLGETPSQKYGNIFTELAKVASKKQSNFKVFGQDYLTRDGTCIRDYVHVRDIARAHLLALDYFQKANQSSFLEYINLGTGQGHSILELIHLFEKINHVKIPFQFCPRRLNEISEVYASINKAKSVLTWEPEYTLENICQDYWRFCRSIQL